MAASDPAANNAILGPLSDWLFNPAPRILLSPEWLIVSISMLNAGYYRRSNAPHCHVVVIGVRKFVKLFIIQFQDLFVLYVGAVGKCFFCRAKGRILVPLERPDTCPIRGRRPRSRRLVSTRIEMIAIPIPVRTHARSSG